MAANLLATEVLDTVMPIAIIGVIYYLLVRFWRRGLSRPVDVAFRVTLAILVVWGTILFILVGILGGLSRALYIYWEYYYLQVTVGSFSLVWSVVTLWEFRNQASDVALSVTSRAWMRVQAYIALVVVAVAVMALLGYGYREQQLNVAGDNTIAPQRLRAMYHGRLAGMGSQMMTRLAGNTATPIDVLQQLARHDDYSVRLSVCSNPATPLSVLSGLAIDENWRIRGCVARHPNASKTLLTQLASDQSFAVRRSVALNKAAPPELLLKLSRDSHQSVRTILASNKSTPVAALASLAKDSDENVRRLVARHPALPLKQQLQLAEDKLAIIRGALLSKRIVPREVLAKLENDHDATIRRRVQERYGYYRRLEMEKQNTTSH